MSSRVFREQQVNDRVRVEIIRSSLGQVTEYDVYVEQTIPGGYVSDAPKVERTYEGGGTRRQADRLFERTVRKFGGKVAA